MRGKAGRSLEWPGDELSHERVVPRVPATCRAAWRGERAAFRVYLRRRRRRGPPRAGMSLSAAVHAEPGLGVPALGPDAFAAASALAFVASWLRLGFGPPDEPTVAVPVEKEELSPLVRSEHGINATTFLVIFCFA